MFSSLKYRIRNIYYKRYLSSEQHARKIGIKVGIGCNISTREFSSEPYLITIGNNVRLARNVQLLTHGGIWSLRKLFPEHKDLDYYGKITIGNNVYVGQGVIIMPGVTIEDNCIIGASSVVTKSVPKNSVVAGNPAKYISSVDRFLEGILKYDTKLHGKSAEHKKNVLLKELPEEKFIRKDFLKIS
jgi:acetyltransferase-like isoleucine patch superfamily enzyme